MGVGGGEVEGGLLVAVVVVGGLRVAGAVVVSRSCICLSLSRMRLLMRAGGRRRRASEMTRSVRERMRFWMCSERGLGRT